MVMSNRTSIRISDGYNSSKAKYCDSQSGATGSSKYISQSSHHSSSKGAGSGGGASSAAPGPVRLRDSRHHTSTRHHSSTHHHHHNSHHHHHYHHHSTAVDLDSSHSSSAAIYAGSNQHGQPNHHHSHHRSSSANSHSSSSQQHHYQSSQRHRDGSKSSLSCTKSQSHASVVVSSADNSSVRHPNEKHNHHGDSSSSKHHSRVYSVARHHSPQRLSRVGSWTEHTSSSGKKYYYNIVSEVSQWDKPSEWVEAEQNNNLAALTSTRHSRSNTSSEEQHSVREDPRPNKSRNRSDDVYNHIGHDKSSEFASSFHAGKNHDSLTTGDAAPSTSSGCVSSGVRVSAHPSRASTALTVSSTPCASETHAVCAREPPIVTSGTLCVSSTISQLSINALTQTSNTVIQSVLAKRRNESAVKCSAILSSSHAQYFREELIQHTQGWPASQIEKQAARMNDDTLHMSTHVMTKAATNLKMARSLVRLADIHAILQEQRILFLRQQVQELENMRIDEMVQSSPLADS